MDPSEWEAVDQLRIRIKERDILEVSKLWGNKPIAEQFLVKEASTWPPPAALRRNPDIPQQGTALTKKFVFFCSSLEVKCGCFDEATSGWDLTKCLAVFEFSVGLWEADLGQWSTLQLQWKVKHMLLYWRHLWYLGRIESF